MASSTLDMAEAWYWLVMTIVVGSDLRTLCPSARESELKVTAVLNLRILATTLVSPFWSTPIGPRDLAHIDPRPGRHAPLRCNCLALFLEHLYLSLVPTLDKDVHLPLGQLYDLVCAEAGGPGGGGLGDHCDEGGKVGRWRGPGGRVDTDTEVAVMEGHDKVYHSRSRVVGGW